ncbi:MAG: LPP20 family lipoprotein [Sphingobacteriaceae bacterium]|nr:LPP20 family lipoprotein [Sphingobacteriaceae bacterium]
MRTYFKYLVLILLFSNVSIAQKKGQQSTTPTLEAKTPNWVSNRPHSGFKYVGIGVGDKGRSDYKTEAKQNALFDLASEIKVDISTNSVLHSVSSNTSFDQSFNSMIKLTASDNIEGYTMVDSYENDKQYLVYYELDKAEHAKRKEQKKQNTLTKAANLIALSFADEKNKNFSAALKNAYKLLGY